MTVAFLVEGRLWPRKRAATSGSSLDRSDRKAGNRIVGAWRSNGLHGGSTDTAVSWSVNGVPNGDTTLGTITSAGVYTAPADLPSPATVQITATSHADPAKSGTGNLAITSDITLNLTPNPASVELGATQTFQATVTSSGHPDPSIRWSLSGAACTSGCGTVDANGNYTAPQTLPSPANATLTAQSVADPSKQISAALAITSSFSLQLSAPSGLPAGATATIVATMAPVPGSNPSPILAWALSGPGCSGSSCGTLTVITTQSAGANPIADSARYAAPATAPTPNTVTVTVTSQADQSKKAQATIMIQPGVNVSVSPATVTLAAIHRVTLSVQVNGTSNSSVNWNVNGTPGGNATLGQICAVGSNPCQIVTSTAASQVDYLAPGSIPSPNPVSVTAVSAADSTKSASAQITVINHVLVSVLPGSVTLVPMGVQASLHQCWVPATRTLFGSCRAQRVGRRAPAERSTPVGLIPRLLPLPRRTRFKSCPR